jgi:hypothetical protein
MRLFRREAARFRTLRIESLECRYALDSGMNSPPITSFAAALVDDTYEENDTLATAKNLGTLSGTSTISNLVMADASDFFKFTTTATGTSTSKIVLNFTHSQGDLDVVLYNSAGSQLKISQGVTNSETLSLSGLAAGTYSIRVYGYRGVSNPAYSLAFTTPGTTTPLPVSTIDLTGAAFSAPDSSTWGSSLNITAAVKNSGNTAAGSFREQWYLSRDTTYSTDDVSLGLSTGVNYATVSGLAAGANTSLSATLALPSALPTGWTGTSFYLVMRTDSAGSVTETNENNNGGQAGAGLDYEAITIATVTTPPNTSGFTITLNMTGLTAAQQQIFQTAAARWSQAIIGDLPNVTYNGTVIDDVLINASAVAIDGAGGILGQAGPDRVRSSSQGGLPYLGTMQFDSADLASMQANGTLMGVILHEMGHVLGIGTLWSSKGLLSGAGTANPRFTGAQATAAYNAIFGRSDTSVPVENTGGSGTRDSHWRESVFTSELMTGWASGGLQMSRVTIGSLADIGYVVNMNAADAFTPSSSATNFIVAGNGSSSSLLVGVTVQQSTLTTPSSSSFERNAFFAAFNDRGNSSASITTLTRSNSAITTLTSLTRTNSRLTGAASLTASNGLGQRVVSSSTQETISDCDTSESASLESIFGDDAADWRA